MTKENNNSIQNILLIAKKIENINNANINLIKGNNFDTQRFIMIIPIERTSEERQKLSII